ncbi:hypothetical protein CHLNCDRAFT_136205 [Chlorella variabilis]|uniref:Uncharacterized protein n=1 Tax=Chlorella variabilis TaxID=554065 RepID=E1ZK03_CHLVA|nr:hypothetical protein CHLNCDRAFT_136205 [Chlorella variabilis]EFN54084.1 hypothetical protein CHLNCDRAFT_136205 [Chlorella variabilis]|eukprot:XP_005846186.1 hypothetical protein CHLNCDRAFT_136205 [Chlorella variabilis]
MALRVAAWGLLLVAAATPLVAGSRVLQDESEVPNIVMFSVDDSLLDGTWGLAYDDVVLASGAQSPAGCRPPITWFINCCAHGGTSSDCPSVQRAHALGHEIATHTMSHSHDTLTYDQSQWSDDVGGQRDWTVNECGIPADEVVGFRAPFFKTTDVLGQVLQDLGFMYDSSLRGEGESGDLLAAGRLGSTSPDCHGSEDSTCNWSGFSFWEVPAYAPPGGGRSDPEPVDGMSTLERFQADFDRKQGTGIPVSIIVHGPFLEDPNEKQDIADFLAWAAEQPNTWFLTYRQFIA